jgi:dynein heavy chain
MKFGFDLFKINYVPSPDLEYVEKEIAYLEDVWNTKD